MPTTWTTELAAPCPLKPDPAKVDVHQHVCSIVHCINRPLLPRLMLVLFLIFITCNSTYAIVHICHTNSVCLTVRPSITRVICIKTAERIIEILSPSDRPIILVFRHQGSLRKSDSVTPNGSAKYKGVAIFDQYAAICRKR